MVVLKATEFASETYKGLAWKSQWSVGGLRMVSYLDNWLSYITFFGASSSFKIILKTFSRLPLPWVNLINETSSFRKWIPPVRSSPSGLIQPSPSPSSSTICRIRFCKFWFKKHQSFKPVSEMRCLTNSCKTCPSKIWAKSFYTRPMLCYVQTHTSS